MSSAIQQLYSKQFLVVVSQAILLKYSPMKTTLKKLSFVCQEYRIIRVLWQFFLCDRFRFQFHILLTDACMEVMHRL